jgi:hypothetical protein
VSNVRDVTENARGDSMCKGLAPAVYFADVLTHIANHVMDEGDVQAWWLVSNRQNQLFPEHPQDEEEGDEGKRTIREHLDTWVPAATGRGRRTF